jgi:hypothetical protein
MPIEDNSASVRGYWQARIAADTAPIAHQLYLSDIVFSTGIAAHEDVYIVASGESDLACRITHIPKAVFA